MPQPIITVDAFTDTAFSGNPAAVCMLERPRDDQWLQCVAREMNLAETAFLLRQEDGYGLRWLTPAVEVDLCGHATLASAHVLWEDGHLPAGSTAFFHTRSGRLTARRNGDWIELDFPALPAESTEPPSGLEAALGIKPRWFGKSRFDYLVEIEDEASLRRLRPDFAFLRKLTARGVIVTAPGTGAFDFVSRFFAPAAGIDEDPVTGSAHCVLAPYWSKKLGRGEMTGFQASTRGGVVRVRLAGDRVILGGHAVTVLRGELVGD
jgi:PhzF family phenazine biosynthesis protein